METEPSVITRLWFLLVGAMFVVAGCGRSPSGPVANNSSSPVVKVRDPTSLSSISSSRVVRVQHDFGLLSPGARVNHRFTFNNESRAQWTVSEIRVSCVCNVADTSQRVIGPGSEGWVDVAYHAPSERSDENRSVVMTFTEPEAPVLVFTVRASVRDACEIEPKLLDLRHTVGAVAERQGRVLSLESYGSFSFGELTAEAEAEWLQVVSVMDVTPPLATPESDDAKAIVRPSESYRVRISADPAGLSEGVHSGKIVLASATGNLAETQIDGDGTSPAPSRWEVPVNLVVEAPIELHPPTLFFGELPSSGSRTKSVEIEFLAPVRRPPIDTARISHDLGDAVSANLAEVGSNRWRLDCRLSANSSTGILQNDITILLEPPLPTIKIPVTAMVEAVE